ncbi:[Pyruvate dehydrogenase [acetyl-transferring]]-phosphatase 1, mitochondrial, partial [Physocladia obscura]
MFGPRLAKAGGDLARHLTATGRVFARRTMSGIGKGSGGTGSNRGLVAAGVTLSGGAAAYFGLRNETTGPGPGSGPASRVGGSGLTADEADAVLRADQTTVLLPREFRGTHATAKAKAKAKRQATVVRIDSASVASNEPREDYAAAHALDADGGALLVGVFDGHGGTECAAAVQRLLPAYVAAALLPPRATLGETLHAR